MNDIFEEVNVEKVSDKIVEQLKGLIVEGMLNPGDKLPGERQLINLLGVGRSSLREALNTLETMGYIEIRKRKGNYVKSINSTVRLEPLKRIMQEDRKRIVQLYEIRCDIEKSTAYEAALKRTPEDIEGIRRSLKAFEGDRGEPDFSWDRDQSFHLSVAKASHNFLRIHIIMDIYDFSKDLIEPVISEFMSYDQYLDMTVKQHESIFDAIVRSDAERAKQCMEKHLTWANVKLSKYFERNSKG